MNPWEPAVASSLVELRGGRRHRFMESADINAAFREVFMPLRHNIRRGMGIDGEIYALEMDACIPGELLGTDWVPMNTRGLDAALLVDPVCRGAVFDQLLQEPRNESLFAYVCERSGEPTSESPGRVLYVEIVSADGCHAAEYPIVKGRGWRFRELQTAPHRRLAPAERR